MDNKEFTLKGTIEKGVSKQGAEYEYLNLKLTPDYSKKVFLDNAEKVLLVNSNKTFDPFKK